jgi:hypothetical protein
MGGGKRGANTKISQKRDAQGAGRMVPKQKEWKQRKIGLELAQGIIVNRLRRAECRCCIDGTLMTNHWQDKSVGCQW